MTLPWVIHVSSFAINPTLEMPQPFIQASAQNANGGLGSYLQLPPVGGGGGGGGGGAVLYPDMLHMSKFTHFFGGDQTDPKYACGGPNSILRTGVAVVLYFIPSSTSTRCGAGGSGGRAALLGSCALASCLLDSPAARRTLSRNAAPRRQQRTVYGRYYPSRSVFHNS